MNVGKQFLSYLFGTNNGDGNTENAQFQFNSRKAVVLKIFVFREKPVFLVSQNWNKTDFELRSFYKEEDVNYTAIKDQFENLSAVTFNVIDFSLLLEPGEHSAADNEKEELLFKSHCDSLLLQLEELHLKCDLLRIAVIDRFKEKLSKILSLFSFDKLVFSNPNKFTAQELLDIKIAPNVIELRCGWLTSLPEDLTLFNRFKRISFVLETFDGLESLLVNFYKKIQESKETRGSLETIRFLRHEKYRISNIPGLQKLSMEGYWQSVFRLEIDGTLIGIAGGADYYVIHFLPLNITAEKFSKYREDYRRKNDW